MKNELKDLMDEFNKEQEILKTDLLNGDPDEIEDSEEKGILNALSPRELKYCYYYIETGNKTKSAIAAGYAVKSAQVSAQSLHKRQRVINAMEFLKKLKATDLESHRIRGFEDLYIVLDECRYSTKRDYKVYLKAIELLLKYSVTEDYLKALVKDDNTLKIEFTDNSDKVPLFIKELKNRFGNGTEGNERIH